MGNRGGCFHRPDQTLKDRRWSSRRWIICLLAFKDRRRKLMQPGLYTELFFLDEATALAGGHRPCYECRRSDALAFREALDRAGLVASGESVDAVDQLIAGEIQGILKGADREMVDPAALPDGAFYAVTGEAFLKRGKQAMPWSFHGYKAPRRLHREGVRLTPRTTCAALAAGYVPVAHATAMREGAE